MVLPVDTAGDHLYLAYGLTIESNLSLPLPRAGDGLTESLDAARGLAEPDGRAADVRIVVRAPQQQLRRSETVGAGREAAPPRGCYWATPQEAHLHYDRVADVQVRRGAEIELHPFPEVGSELLSQLASGVALGILLHQRGHFTLHASAVEIGGGAIAFAAWKRMGKSTSAAAFHAAGHPLISDDTVVCDRSSVDHVLPGVRQFKLDPDAAAQALQLDPDSLPRLHENFERRLHRVDDGYRGRVLPLQAVYVLDWGDAVGVQELAPGQAFQELARHSYALRFLGHRGGVTRHFQQLSELARSVPVRKLTRPPSVDALPEVVRAVQRCEGLLPLEA